MDGNPRVYTPPNEALFRGMMMVSNPWIRPYFLGGEVALRGYPLDFYGKKQHMIFQPKNDYPPPGGLTAKAPKKWWKLQDSLASYWIFGHLFQGLLLLAFRRVHPWKLTCPLKKAPFQKERRSSSNHLEVRSPIVYSLSACAQKESK